jgi:hypothetical protein
MQLHKIQTSANLSLDEVIKLHAMLHGLLEVEEKLPAFATKICIPLYLQLNDILDKELTDEEYAVHIEQCEKGFQIGSEIATDFFGELNIIEEIQKRIDNEKDN